jgi:hypothetical protein
MQGRELEGSRPPAFLNKLPCPGQPSPRRLGRPRTTTDPQYGGKSWIAEVNVRMSGVHQSDIEPLHKRGFRVQRNLLATTTEVSSLNEWIRHIPAVEGDPEVDGGRQDTPFPAKNLV